MAKFILVMFICSGVPGNDCKPMPTPIIEFNSYHECAIYGYEFSTELLKVQIEEIKVSTSNPLAN